MFIVIVCICIQINTFSTKDTIFFYSCLTNTFPFDSNLCELMKRTNSVVSKYLLISLAASVLLLFCHRFSRSRPQIIDDSDVETFKLREQCLWYCCLRRAVQFDISSPELSNILSRIVTFSCTHFASWHVKILTEIHIIQCFYVKFRVINIFSHWVHEKFQEIQTMFDIILCVYMQRNEQADKQDLLLEIKWVANAKKQIELK